MSASKPNEQDARPDAARAAVIPTDRVRAVATWAASRAAVGLHTVFRRPRTPAFGILMYHRVTERTPGAAEPTYNVTPDRLRSQLRGLLDRGFEPWPLARILAVHQSGQPVPSHVFAVTFDDGYENNLLSALPILQELQVPATIFLATAFLDSDRPFPSDDWCDAGAPHVPPSSWRPLTTAQCHELLASNLIALGAHTHTHQFFLGRAEAFRQDLAESVRILAERFGVENPPFAFPFGDTSPELVAAARDCGVSCALTVRFACVSSGDDPYDWGRFNAAATDTATTLAAKLSGWYAPVAATLRAVKRPLSALRRGRHESDSPPDSPSQSGKSTSPGSAADMKVTVIIPTYNRAKYIRDAVDSALNQTHPPHEVLVIDDGSTDETPEILARYQAPVRVIRQVNRGRSAARNVGLDQAQGDVIIFLDSDDILLPTNLERFVEALTKNPRAAVAYSDALIVDGENEAVELYTAAMPGPRPSGMVLGELSRRCFLTVSSMVRRSSLEGLRFDTRMNYAEDYEFWWRLAGRWEFEYVGEPLMCYRYHELMTVATGMIETLNAELEVQRRIMATRDFNSLPAIERARSYCSHGAKNAVLDRQRTALEYFARAVRTAPLYPGGYVLGSLGLMGQRALKYAIMKRRQVLGNQLGTNMGEKALSQLGGSEASRGPAYGRAQAQLAAFTGRARD